MRSLGYGRRMPELEQRLRDLARHVEWPETPPLPPGRAPVGLPGRGPGEARRRRAALALAAALVLAATVAMLVPGARSAILDWLRIGGVRVERVDELPGGLRPAEVSALGPEVDAATAAGILGRAFALPPDAPTTTVLRARDGIVSTVLATAEGPVLLSELRSDELPFVLKKLAATTRIAFVRVTPGGMAAWVSGAEHAVLAPGAPPRLAGNVLVWDRNGVTYRLEGRMLGRLAAISLARSITPP